MQTSLKTALAASTAMITAAALTTALQEANSIERLYGAADMAKAMQLTPDMVQVVKDQFTAQAQNLGLTDEQIGDPFLPGDDELPNPLYQLFQSLPAQVTEPEPVATDIPGTFKAGNGAQSGDFDVVGTQPAAGGLPPPHQPGNGVGHAPVAG